MTMPAPHPVDVEQALGKQPCPVFLSEDVEVAERSDHQAALAAVDRHVMGQAVGLASGAVSRECEHCALSDEVCGGVVLRFSEAFDQ